MRLLPRKRLRVEITGHMRVGEDWIACPSCGCKYPPDKWCPYRQYHDPDCTTPNADYWWQS